MLHLSQTRANEDTLTTLAPPCKKSLDTWENSRHFFISIICRKLHRWHNWDSFWYIHWYSACNSNTNKCSSASSSSSDEEATNSFSVLPEDSDELRRGKLFSCRQAAPHIQADTNFLSMHQLGLPLSHHSLHPVSHCTNYRIPGTTPPPPPSHFTVLYIHLSPLSLCSKLPMHCKETTYIN